MKKLGVLFFAICSTIASFALVRSTMDQALGLAVSPDKSLIKNLSQATWMTIGGTDGYLILQNEDGVKIMIDDNGISPLRKEVSSKETSLFYST